MGSPATWATACRPAPPSPPPRGGQSVGQGVDRAPDSPAHHSGTATQHTPAMKGVVEGYVAGEGGGEMKKNDGPGKGG
jgi:hypothetical protein